MCDDVFYTFSFLGIWEIFRFFSSIKCLINNNILLFRISIELLRDFNFSDTDLENSLTEKYTQSL